MKRNIRRKTRKNAKRTPTRRDDAMARMNDALLAEYDEIKGLITKADRQDVDARYKIAVRCSNVREGEGNGGKYGAGAVAKLTHALGWGKSNIYDYANVARTWPDQTKFVEVFARNDRFDKPLTWSHIVLLATVVDVEHRDKLIDDTLQHGWGVRKLRKKMRTDALGEQDAVPTDAPQPAAPRALVATVEDCVTQVTALKRNVAAFGTRLVDEIKQADPADLTPALVDRLTKTRQDVTDLLKEIDGWIEQIQSGQRPRLRPQDDWESTSADSPQEWLGHEHEVQPQEAVANAS